MLGRVAGRGDPYRARDLAHGGHPGRGGQELPVPAHFEQLAQMVTPEAVAEVVVRPRPEPVLEKIRAFEAAGFDNVYFHQIGPDQAGFLRFAERELMPAAGGRRRVRSAR